ncbi:MAG: PA14 domain-containing protein [Luteibaculaceae bacterium]
MNTNFYSKRLTIFLSFSLIAVNLYAQCPAADPLSRTEAGVNSFIGHIWQFPVNSTTPSENLFNEGLGAVYQGRITPTPISGDPTRFDEGFGGATGTFNTQQSCAVNRDWFSARFIMRTTLEGNYTFSVASDDGARLNIRRLSDGTQLNASSVWVNSATPIYFLARWTNTGLGTTTATTAICLPNEEYEIVVEYYERTGGNRVSFNYTNNLDGTPGIIAGNQNLCITPPNTTTATGNITSTLGAANCSEPPLYQWESSTTSTGPWTDIPGATAATFNPGNISATTFYRRRVTNLPGQPSSNVVSKTVNTIQGDRVTVGDEEFRAYFYQTSDFTNPFTQPNYRGERFFNEQFDTEFCITGNATACDVQLNGCPVVANNFVVQAFMEKQFTGGTYTFRTRSDDGVRLFLNGNPLINQWATRPFPADFDISTPIFFDGTTLDELRLEYYEAGGDQRLQFNWIFENTLPVELTFAQLTCKGFEWKTASELNNHFFTISHSLNGVDFEPLYYIDGHGTTNIPRSYAKHFTPQKGVIYRLEQTDFDGTFTPLHTASVACETQATFSILGKNIQINTLENPEKLCLFNLAGQKVWSKTVQPGDIIQLPSLTKGIYIVSLGNTVEKLSLY